MRCLCLVCSGDASDDSEVQTRSSKPKKTKTPAVLDEEDIELEALSSQPGFHVRKYSLLRVTVHRANGLPAIARLGTMSPYVHLEVGSLQERTEVILNGGKNPLFGDSRHYLPLDGTPKQRLDLYVKSKGLMADTIVGKASISSTTLLGIQGPMKHTLTLYKHDAPPGMPVAVGTLNVTINTTPPFIVNIHQAKDLQNTSKISPYVNVTFGDENYSTKVFYLFFFSMVYCIIGKPSISPIYYSS